ncbi:esterase [Rhizobium wenxiniae]|uniref:Pimeloyl-ACP methyl ester carboxylesterase n=1 Tax=Rhizobium wenxiniae TaxID=1737357 RepID=A0A7W9YAC4_9HYPH|nr:alpha/beta hydrolase [Rhizobium wenxiniae]MBB6164797.1 pimeloyl-ACP methyl ester carboxylesterase [Rhizobium wenxiniae]GGG05729.1 esterase [Rhizobium wenxiniae]
MSLLIWCSASFGQPAAHDAEAQPLLTDVGGYRLNSILIQAGGKKDLPPIVFIHGASTSLYDPMLSFRERLEGRGTLLFVDRPGHGRSDAGGSENVSPDGQADAISTLMEKHGIGGAIIVGHSFGGAIAAALAIRHPDKVRGLVFLSPAVYPWSSGVAWYYDAASAPVAGALFSAFIVPPLGLLAINRATKAVFAPNQPPAGYVEKTKALQAIRPQAFRHNAREIAALSDWAKVAAKQYRYIKAPTIIITGDTDKIVSPDIHARHLARDIPGARLIVVHNLGHKSDYIANDLAIAAIERVAGRKVDLLGMARAVEKRIANDRSD